MILRPNIAMDAPPTSIEVGGFVYNIKTDYRLWIQVLADLREILPTMETDDDTLHNAIIITKISTDILGAPMKFENAEQIGEFVAAVAQFAQGYPQPPVVPDPAEHSVQTYSLEQDLGSIVEAFQHYYGVDISYKCENYHWWLFMEGFRALSGDDLQINNLMQIRGYTGKDATLRKLAARYALPRVETAEERRMDEAIRKEFYGAQ